MKAFGWTLDELNLACVRASHQADNDFRLADWAVVSQRSRHGNQTISFRVELAKGGARLKLRNPTLPNVLYPNCVTVNYQFNGTPRGGGGLCWHAFGHVFRAMFDIHPKGKIRTGHADYDDWAHFVANTDQARQTMPRNCECHLTGKGIFHNE